MRRFFLNETGGVTGWSILVLGIGVATGAAFVPGSDKDATLDRLDDALGPAVEIQVLTG